MPEPAAEAAPAAVVHKPKRTREQTRTLIERLRTEEPGITDAVIAGRLGITDRWVRAVGPYYPRNSFRAMTCIVGESENGCSEAIFCQPHDR